MIDIVDPDKIVNYPLGTDDKGGALFLYGNPNASKMAICCAGFPDDHSIFQSFAARLAKENSCFVGITCMPGFDDRPDKPWTSHPPNGYKPQEWTSNIAEAVKALKQESTFEGATLTGIFHDWGTLPGATWSNQVLKEENGASQVDRLVYFDVLPMARKSTKDLPSAPRPTVYATLATWLYRIVFVLTYLLDRNVSHYVAFPFLMISFTILNLLNLTCTRQIDSKVTMMKEFTKEPRRFCYMMYPYLTMFTKAFMTGQDFRLPKDLKTTPVLYLYGLDKNCQFHDERAVKLLEREDKEGRSISNAISLENAGHFLYIQQEDICLEAVKTFMNKKKC